MSYQYQDRKIVCLVNEGLESWQTMNVVGHLAVALGANKDEFLIGTHPLIDASTAIHHGIARFGFIIKKGSAEAVREVVTAARENQQLMMLDFPREMLETATDEELVASLATKDEAELEYLGVLLYGPTAEVQAHTKKFPLWGEECKTR